MLENKFTELNAHEQILYQQVAANPSYKKILYLEQEELQQQILQFFRLENESDANYCRRLENTRVKLMLIEEFISLNEYAIELK